VDYGLRKFCRKAAETASRERIEEKREWDREPAPAETAAGVIELSGQAIICVDGPRSEPTWPDRHVDVQRDKMSG
jgi:hypothetical protein